MSTYVCNYNVKTYTCVFDIATSRCASDSPLQHFKHPQALLYCSSVFALVAHSLTSQVNRMKDILRRDSVSNIPCSSFQSSTSSLHHHQVLSGTSFTCPSHHTLCPVFIFSDSSQRLAHIDMPERMGQARDTRIHVTL